MSITRGMTVLAIEDDSSLREVLDLLFAQEPGMYYTVAAGGANGISKLETGPPDVLLTDLMMPRVSGEDVIKYARGRYPGIPIVAFSSKSASNGSGRMHMVDGQAVRFLNKPFDLSELLAIVHELAEDQSWRSIRTK